MRAGVVGCESCLNFDGIGRGIGYSDGWVTLQITFLYNVVRCSNIAIDVTVRPAPNQPKDPFDKICCVVVIESKCQFDTEQEIDTMWIGFVVGLSSAFLLGSSRAFLVQPLKTTKLDITSSSTILFFRARDEKALSAQWFGNTKHPIKSISEIPKAKKHTLVLEGQSFEKKRGETVQHVLVKAVLKKLFEDEYGTMHIEHDTGDPDYTPDAVALNKDGEPVFWGESGRISVRKAVNLCERYPNTHIVHCRWGFPNVDEFAREEERAIRKISRPGRYTFGSLPNDVWKYFDDDGNIHISKDDVEWKEVEFIDR